MAGQNPNENNKAVANLLLKKGLATKEQIQKAIAHQKKSDKSPSLLRVLVGMKVLDKETAQKVQTAMKKPKSQAPEKPVEPAKSSTGGFTFTEDDDEILAREKKAGSLGVQMFDGQADISGIDLAEDDSDKIMKKKADYFEPVEAAAKKLNQKGKQQAKKKKKAPVNPDELKCQNCGAKVKENQRRCKECGMPLDLEELRSRPQDISKKNWKMYAIPAVVLIIVVIAIVMFMGKEDPETKKDPKVTAKEQREKERKRVNKLVNNIYKEVEAIEKLKSDEEKEKECIRLQGEITKLMEENDVPEYRFEKYIVLIKKTLKNIEDERKRKEKEAKIKKNDDDDNDVIKNDDDESDDDDEGTEEISKAHKDKIEKFNKALTDLFASYKKGWDKPTSEFSDAANNMKRSTTKYTIPILVDKMNKVEEPITELPEVTKEDGEIIAQYEPWGFCISLIANESQLFKTDESKNKVVEMYKKYMSRYPNLIVNKIRSSVGEEYILQVKDYLYKEIEIDNEMYLNNVKNAKIYIITFMSSLDDQYDKQVAEIFKPLMNHENYDWARKVYDWFLKSAPEMVVEEAVNWLRSEDEERVKYAKMKIKKYAENDNASTESQKMYAEAIVELIKDQKLPDLTEVRLVLLLNREIGIDLLVKIMKTEETVLDENYFRTLVSIVHITLRNEIAEYYPKLIEILEIHVKYREELLDKLNKEAKRDKKIEEITIELIFRLLKNENDKLNPLEIAKGITKGKKEFWAKFKQYFDNHKRKDCFELLMAMHDCDPTKTMTNAYEFIIDDKANDQSRSKILNWYYEQSKINSEISDEKILELTNKITTSSTKPEIKTLAIIEQIKVDLLFKKCDNKDFEQIGSRINQVAIGSTYSTLIALDDSGKALVSADQTGGSFKVYDLRSGGKTEINRKLVSETWAAYKKAKAKWDALEKKGDKVKPLPPPGKEIDYKEQIIAVSSKRSTDVRFLTSTGNIEYWNIKEENLTPHIEDAPLHPGYCSNIQSLSEKIKELQGITLTPEIVTTTNDGSTIAIRIAGSDVLIINADRRRLLSKLSPGSFKVMKFNSEGDKILFYGGENKKTTVFDVDKPKKGLVINMIMQEYDYAGFAADDKYILVSNDGFLWRFHCDTGEKDPVYIVPSFPPDTNYITFTMDKGRYLGEIHKGKIRIRQIKNGKTEGAIGRIDDEAEVAQNKFAISGKGETIAFLMRDSSVMIFKVG